MNSSKSQEFSKAELELMRVWAVPNVLGDDEDVIEKAEPEPVDDDLPPVLTLEEIETIQKQAYDEAFAQGQKEGYEHGVKQGFDDGFSDGCKRGYEENQHILQEQADQLVLLLGALAEPFKKLDAEVEQELVTLSIGIATQIIRREIKMDPGQIIATVREAINVLPLSSQKICLYLHPEDADLVRSALSLDDMSSAWTVVEDPLLTRGGCKVDTDVSRVDATVENRLAAVIANVLGGEREQDRS
jgi:flagellar assembly protein FliH